MMTGMNTLLQSAVADEYRGRIFGTYGMTGALLALIGAVLAGTLADRVGAVTLLNIQGVRICGSGPVSAGLAAWRAARRPAAPK